MKRLIYSGLFFFMILLFSGCVKRELELSEGENVRINFDWSHLAEQHNIPSFIQIRFYNQAGEYLFVYTSTPEHYQAYLPEGKYKILVYTSDTTGIGYEHMNNFGEAQITVSPQIQEETPGNLSNVYGTSIQNLAVSTEQSVDTTVTVRPYLHLVNIHLKITGSSAEVVDCSAIIDGVAQAVNLSTGLPVLGTNSSVSTYLFPQNEDYQGTLRLTGNDDRYPSVISFKLRFNDGTERIIHHNFADFMDKIDQNQSDATLSLELTIDIQSIDGVFIATLTDWIYKQGDILLN